MGNVRWFLCQISHTESNFDVAMNIDLVARHKTHIQEIEYCPHFPLQYQTESEERDLSDEKDFVRKLHLDEDDINELENGTRNQAKGEKFTFEHKYRFTASKFHFIAHRQRNHETFASTNTSRNTSYGPKYESEAVDASVKQMNNRSMLVQVFRSDVGDYRKEAVLGYSPDGNVIDTVCAKPFGSLEVKCPETEFLVTPLEACSDPNLCCQNIDGKCKFGK